MFVNADLYDAETLLDLEVKLETRNGFSHIIGRICDVRGTPVTADEESTHPSASDREHFVSAIESEVAEEYALVIEDMLRDETYMVPRDETLDVPFSGTEYTVYYLEGRTEDGDWVRISPKFDSRNRASTFWQATLYLAADYDASDVSLPSVSPTEIHDEYLTGDVERATDLVPREDITVDGATIDTPWTVFDPTEYHDGETVGDDDVPVEDYRPVTINQLPDTPTRVLSETYHVNAAENEYWPIRVAASHKPFEFSCIPANPDDDVIDRIKEDESDTPVDALLNEHVDNPLWDTLQTIYREIDAPDSLSVHTQVGWIMLDPTTNDIVRYAINSDYRRDIGYGQPNDLPVDCNGPTDDDRAYDYDGTPLAADDDSASSSSSS